MGARAVVIFIALWSIIQGLAYAVMSILALLAHNCHLSMKYSKITYLMYIIFFRDRECGLINWNLVAEIPPPYEPTWPDVTMVAFRTIILMTIYLVLSGLWILTSFTLIVGCCLPNMGRLAYHFAVHPWILISTLIVVFDIVAVGFFFYDLFNTLSMDVFMTHLEMSIPSTVYQPFVINADILPIPAIIMLLVAARGFIFWCLNIILLLVVFSKTRKAIFSSHHNGVRTTQNDFRYERNGVSHNNTGDMIENDSPGARERSRYSDPVRYQSQYQYDNMSYQQDKYDLNRDIGRRYVEPLKDGGRDEKDNGSRLSNVKSTDESISKKSWSADSQHSGSTAYANRNLSAQVPSQKLLQQQSWKEYPSDAVLKIDRPHFRLPNKSSLLKKLSDSSYTAAEEPHRSPAVSSTSYTNDELRSQLPWSYFQTRPEVATKPKKTFTELRDDEELPPVPVPDYTVEAVRKIRPQSSAPPKQFINPPRRTNPENDNTRWSGPEYRY